MIGTRGIVNGQQKKYRPNLYEDKSIQVKDFFDSVQAATKNDMPTQSKSKSQPQPQHQSQSQSQSTLDIYTQSTYTPQIRDIPAKKSFITAFKEMQARMENGERPTQDDMKILWELSSKTLDSDSYSYDEEQSRLDLLNWGGITPQLKTFRTVKSYITRLKETQARMENGEMPTIEDMDILWDLYKKDLDPSFADDKAKQLRLDLLRWGGFDDSQDVQSSKFTTGFYKKLYDLTSINQIDKMMDLLKREKEAILQKGNSKDGGNINTLE